MKCKRAAELLPELVSGELDERTQQTVLEHVENCKSCSRCMAKYEEALGALSIPRIMAAVPASLESLHVPEPAYRPILAFRPAIAASMAIALAALGFWIVAFYHASQSPISPSRKPQIQAVGPDHKIANHAKADSPKVVQIASKNTVAHKTAPFARTDWHHSTKAKPVPVSTPKTMISANTPRHKQSEQDNIKYPSIVVVVNELPKPQPSSIDVETYDPISGKTSVYSYRRDTNGSEHKIEITVMPHKEVQL